MIEVKAPNEFIHISKFSIFLAGSIEMGAAEEWQTAVCRQLSQYDIALFNPRRDDWDSSWVQRKSDERFYEQLEWGLRAMEHADVVLIYFAPGTKSPISLLEFGLYANSKKLVVCCPETFWRRGNVEIVCERYNIPMIAKLSDLTTFLLYSYDRFSWLRAKAQLGGDPHNVQTAREDT